ncbi:MAG: arylsulfatase [Candidatus Hydrogenedentes bacterium]|nr:arylsulfatase [Candidatus Hydrogenedentota bacterium]
MYLSILVLQTLCAAALLGLAALPVHAADRPNIIVILADDLGYSDIGCYGSEVDTPNLDRLANGGIRFRQFYNASRCCPSRAALLTGLYPHQTGVGHMADREFNYGEPGYTGALNRSCVTIAEVLKPAGYQTFMSGKWHVAMERGSWPHDRGFDDFYGIVHGAANFFKVGPFSMLARNNDLIEQEPGDYYLTEALSGHAIEYIRSATQQDKPYFLYLAYTAPHFPLQARAAGIEKYRGKYMDGWDALRQHRLNRQKELGIFDDSLALSPRDGAVPPWEEVENKDSWDLSMAVYAAMIDSMDQNIGRVLDAVHASGKEANTLILFLSDNGGTPEPLHLTPDVPPGPETSFHTVDAPWANASNTPFRLYKRWAHEGGIRTPCIVRWPAVIPERLHGTLVDDVGHVIDLMATCVEAAGAHYPETFGGQAIPPFEGQSLLPILRGDRLERRAPLYWEHEGNRAVRAGRWKLVSCKSNWGMHLSLDEVTWASNEWELYDMTADPVELHNLASSMPEKVRELSAGYHQWADSHAVKDWEDLLPTYRLNQEKRAAADAQ